MTYLTVWLGADVPCGSCGSTNRNEFNGEIAIHFPGLDNLDKPIVWVFPKLLICMDCGATEFTVPRSELGLLARCDAAGTGNEIQLSPPP